MTMRNLFVRVDKNSQSPARRGNQAAGQQQWLRHAATATMPELFRELNSSEEGLAAEQVDAAREFYGANAVAQATKRPLPLRLLAAFADPFTYILVFIAAVSVLTDWIFATGADRDLSTPLIIGTMVLVSGVLRFIQDEKSTVAAEALAEMVESCAEVERDGDGGNETPIDEIVIGDVVHLSSGDVVPADLRIFSARDLFVSQASLTGESEPVEKRASLAADASATAAASAPALTDLESLAFMGSTVISGNARGIVVATGARTMFGEATDTLAGRKRETSFDAGIKSTSRLLMRLMLAMLPVVFVVSGATKGDWVSALLFSLSVAVGLTPEMLPMLVTTCLGKGAVDLSRHHVIVKRLDAIQDLGAIDVLCTDKTGTLTEDRIVLERHLDVNGREDARVLRYAFLNSYFSTGVKNLIDNAIVERALAEGTDEVNATVGSTTTAEELAERYHGIDELPFDFERRRLSVVVGDAAGHTRFRLATIVKVIMNSGEYKATFLERAAKFELMYPVLVKRGFAALIWVPLVLLALMFVLPHKFAMLMLWILSLVVICTFLIVVEYLHTRVSEKTTLADMAPEQLYALLDDELREEFMAFAPLDKMRLERRGDIAADQQPKTAEDNDAKTETDSTKGGEA